MKKLTSLQFISSVVMAVISAVVMILFIAANNGSKGNFEGEFVSVPYVVTFSILAIVAALLVAILPLLPIPEKFEGVVSIVVDVLVVAVAVLLCLDMIYICKASVYEMALTWYSELHAGEDFMFKSCAQALAAAIIAVGSAIIYSILSCFTLGGEKK